MFGSVNKFCRHRHVTKNGMSTSWREHYTLYSVYVGFAKCCYLNVTFYDFIQMLTFWPFWCNLFMPTNISVKGWPIWFMIFIINWYSPPMSMSDCGCLIWRQSHWLKGQNKMSCTFIHFWFYLMYLYTVLNMQLFLLKWILLCIFKRLVKLLKKKT